MNTIELYIDTRSDYCPRYNKNVTITINRFERIAESVTNRWGFYCENENDCPFITQTKEEGRTCPVYHTAPTYQFS